jgi:hypothetical protein
MGKIAATTVVVAALVASLGPPAQARPTEIFVHYATGRAPPRQAPDDVLRAAAWSSGVLVSNRC